MASNGPRSKIELLLRLTGLDAFVPASRVFSAVELGRYKPDPALFLHAAAAMGGFLFGFDTAVQIATG